VSGTPANLGIMNIGQICINVQDLQRATAFYRDVLGLPLLFAVPNLAFFDCAGVRLMLGRAETPEFDHASSILYFRVPDLNLAYQSLVELGVQIFAPPRLIAPMPTYDLWMAAFRDSEGNIHQLMSEVPRPS
jgi:catechol 2,3-dioxygenase-like lactoylglutathione lyase family enzyme